jgi:lysozyme family protein
MRNIIALVGLLFCTTYAQALSFDEAVRHVIKSEGGYSNKENDATGEVRYGITGTTARRAGYRGSMRKLPLSTAKRIYKRMYWDSLPNNISSKAKFIAFDAAVNQGPGYAKQLVRETGGNVNAMLRHRKNRYHQTVRSRPHLRKFLNGWMNRLNSVRRYVGAKRFAKGSTSLASAKSYTETKKKSRKVSSKKRKSSAKAKRSSRKNKSRSTNRRNSDKKMGYDVIVRNYDPFAEPKGFLGRF